MYENACAFWRRHWQLPGECRIGQHTGAACWFWRVARNIWQGRSMFNRLFSRISWRMAVALVTAGFAVLLPLAHMGVFHDWYTFLFYWTLDIAFLPVQVLLVTVIMERVLGERERQAKMHKMNMVIGAFFSELGVETIRRIIGFCGDVVDFQHHLAVDMHWGVPEYQAAGRFAKGNACHFDHNAEMLAELRGFLLQKRAFVLQLLQNPNLLEHDRFTDLLWALCHLIEELAVRKDVSNLPGADVEHLKGDMRRAFNLLVMEWLNYMEHLKKSYPYIYSLAVRTNPFNPSAQVVFGDKV